MSSLCLFLVGFVALVGDVERDPVSLEPIHEPDRVFRADDFKRYLEWSRAQNQIMDSLQDAVREAMKDPKSREQLEKLAKDMLEQSQSDEPKLKLPDEFLRNPAIQDLANNEEFLKSLLKRPDLLNLANNIAKRFETPQPGRPSPLPMPNQAGDFGGRPNNSDRGGGAQSPTAAGTRGTPQSQPGQGQQEGVAGSNEPTEQAPGSAPDRGRTTQQQFQETPGGNEDSGRAPGAGVGSGQGPGAEQRGSAGPQGGASRGGQEGATGEGQGQGVGESGGSGPGAAGGAPPTDPTDYVKTLTEAMRRMGGPLEDSPTLNRLDQALSDPNSRRVPNHPQASTPSQPTEQAPPESTWLDKAVEEAQGYQAFANANLKDIPLPPGWEAWMPSLETIPMPELPPPDLSWSAPTMPMLPSLDFATGATMEPRHGASALVGIAVVIGLIVLLRIFGTQIVSQSYAKGAGAAAARKPEGSAQFNDRASIRKWFEYLAVWKLGSPSIASTHVQIADRLAKTGANLEPAAERLAKLYEQARYLPPQEEVDPDLVKSAAADYAKISEAIPKPAARQQGGFTRRASDT